jgi:anti-sigma factor RsiW
MHAVIQERLEEYMAGALPPAIQRQVADHLASCTHCQQEVSAMQEVSALFEFLKPEDTPVPSPSFAARVMAQVAAQVAAQPRPSLRNLFSLDLAFGRRVVFACLLNLAVLGSYLVTRETEYASGPPNPETIMATEQARPDPAGTDRDRMLVTLASYEP